MILDNELDYAQVVYVSITSLDGVVDDDYITNPEVVYNIKTSFLRQSLTHLLMPYTWFSLGDSGDLQWSVDDSNNLSVEFEDILLNGTTSPTNTSDLSFGYVYELFVSKEQVTGEYLSRCDVLPDAKGVFKDIDMTYSAQTFQQPQQLTLGGSDTSSRSLHTSIAVGDESVYVSLRVTITGVDSAGGTVWEYPFLYQTAQVTKEKNGGHLWLIVGIVTIVVILLVVLIICGVRLNRGKRRKHRSKVYDENNKEELNIRLVGANDGQGDRELELGRTCYGRLVQGNN